VRLLTSSESSIWISSLSQASPWK